MKNMLLEEIKQLNKIKIRARDRKSSSKWKHITEEFIRTQHRQKRGRWG